MPSARAMSKKSWSTRASTAALILLTISSEPRCCCPSAGHVDCLEVVMRHQTGVERISNPGRDDGALAGDQLAELGRRSHDIHLPGLVLTNGTKITHTANYGG